jgi:cytochrome c peroxidase
MSRLICPRVAPLGAGLLLVSAFIAVGVLLRGAALGAPPNLPLGVSPVLWDIAVPPGTEPTPQKIALGEKLFNDVRLSVNDKVSCATCHDPKKGFVDHKAVPDGVTAPKQRPVRNSPTVLHAMFNAAPFWDGRAPSLEEQAKLPILNPIEMGQKTPDDVVNKVRRLPEYKDAFAKVFGHEVTYDDLASAIAAFERTQFAGDSPSIASSRGDEGDRCVGQAGLDAVQRQGALQLVPRVQHRKSALLGPEVPQHRHRRPQDELHHAGAEGRGERAERRPEAGG